MRKIKFRAFVEHFDGSKAMINDFAGLEPDNHFWGADLTNDYPDVLNILSVMQFTGLTDKNGVEIYEGDIVEAEFLEAKILYEVEYRQGFIQPFTDLQCEIVLNYEIVGNVYQNSEMLKDK